jgi:hypothetical protein
MATFEPGTHFMYDHPDGAGFGEHHKGDVLTAEMNELDLKSGQSVILLEYDRDTDWPLVEWIDSNGTNRITTIDPSFFGTYFTEI